MATARAYAKINRPADEVWKLVTDPTAIAAWFPGVATCVLEGDARVVTVDGGMTVTERIVSNDGELRRFQYSLLDLPGCEHHLATVDVLEDGDGSIVVYGTDVLPDALGGAMQGAVTGAIAGLKGHAEGA